MNKKLHLISTASSEFKLNCTETRSLPFSEKVFYRDEKSSNSLPSLRQWLVFSKQNLYCTVCICFSSQVSAFVTGFNDFRRTSQYIQRHENSADHNMCVESYFTNEMMNGLRNEKIETILKTQIDNNRCVVDAIINILKYLSKQGLALRGKSNEAIGNLNSSGNHGNFLELVKLVSLYNQTLANHLNKCMEKSKLANTSRGRGDLVTFLSKNTSNKLMEILKDCVVEKIVDEINQNGEKFGVECDTTQDVSTKDQASIVVRYIHDSAVQERLISFKHSKDGTGKGMYSLIKSSLEGVGLKTGNTLIKLLVVRHIYLS